jgi:hypothetical protein
VRAAKEAPNKYKAGSGSFVPWADPMVQRQFQLSDKARARHCAHALGNVSR